MAFSTLLYDLLLALLFMPSTTVFAQTDPNIRVGASISASQTSSPWLSPSGDFAFGFRQIENKKDMFLLGIWYNEIPDRTIVWYANGDVATLAGSKVELTSDNGLILSNPNGSEIWRSPNMDSGVVSFATMNDTGNFIIWDSTSSVLWQSFTDPRDTILPSQSLDNSMMVYSRRSETDFSKGRFLLKLQDDGDLVLNTRNLPTDSTNNPYYRSGTTKGDSGTSSPGIELRFNESGYFYVLRESGERFFLSTSVPVSTRDFYQRVTLNPDGVLNHYYYLKSSTGNGSWTTLWYQPNNICQASFVEMGSGTCGFNSVCQLGDDGRPTCGCPRGYSLLDPDDLFGSCKPNYTLTCDNDLLGGRNFNDSYDLVEVQKTDWPRSDYALLTPFTEDECRQSCLRDCMCAVAIFRSGNMCWKKRLPLSNGRFDPNLDGKALVKVLKGNIDLQRPNYLPNPNVSYPKEKHREGLSIAGTILLSLSTFLNVILIVTLCLVFFLIYRKKNKQVPNQVNSLQSFSYEELVAATDGFKEELGRGAFSVVYKGTLRAGSGIPVAVKKLNPNSLVADGAKELKTEVDIIGQTHHKNLVRLLGFCNTGEHNLLVYEFMSNGHLSSFLFRVLKPSWNQRIQIALGIAKGLLYLHEECTTQIIHCDIKPQNILLDEYYNAKISDFGISKLLLLGQSHTFTNIRGTKGYLAPEWFRNVPITPKVDVYSYGVLLLEIICCKKNVANIEITTDQTPILIDWAYDCFLEGNLYVLVERDTEALNDLAKVDRFVRVAIWCIQEDPSLRPTMKRVMQMLDGDVDVPVPPSPCPLSVTY